MDGFDLTSIAPVTPTPPVAGIPEPLGVPAVNAPPAREPATAVPDCPPIVRITKRARNPQWRNPRRLDQQALGSRLIVGKARGLFLRDGRMRFRKITGKPAQRPARTGPQARKRRRWEPVVVSPVFPRGPLELPSLGFLHEWRRRSIKTCRGQPVRRNKSRRPDQVA